MIWTTTAYHTRLLDVTLKKFHLYSMKQKCTDRNNGQFDIISKTNWLLKPTDCYKQTIDCKTTEHLYRNIG